MCGWILHYIKNYFFIVKSVTFTDLNRNTNIFLEVFMERINPFLMLFRVNPYTETGKLELIYLPTSSYVLSIENEI